jgi:hypothetical protein
MDPFWNKTKKNLVCGKQAAAINHDSMTPNAKSSCMMIIEFVISFSSVQNNQERQSRGSKRNTQKNCG